jgi:hypothetical protein
METNTSQYDKTGIRGLSLTQQYGIPSAQTRPSRIPITPQDRMQRQREGAGTAKGAPRMPKARAQALARAFKRGLVLASLAVFTSFSGLVAFHQMAGASSQKSSTASQATPTSTPSSSNNFFNQQGGNTFGTGSSTSSGGSDSSSSSSTSSSGSSNSSPSPVSGSHVS